MRFSTFCANCLNSPQRVRVISSFVSSFHQPSNLIIMSPILNSGKQLCTGFRRSVVSRVGRLVAGTSIIAPGLARLFCLLNVPCGRVGASRRLGSCLHRLSSYNPRIIVVADIPMQSSGRGASICTCGQGNGHC